MIHFTGTGSMVRLAMRRDRLRLAVWLIAIPGLVYAQAAGIDSIYADRAELAAAGRLVANNAAFIAMAGPPLALDTIGGRVTFEISAFAIVLAALMNVFLVTRHLRAEEETGRGELIRSAAVGRHATITATLLVALAVDGLLAVLVAASLQPFGLAAAGSWALAIGVAGVGLVFAGIAAVTSQVTVSARAASGLAGVALAVSFVVRGIGDIGSGTLSWFSPMGWGQALRPFAGERWWPVVLLLAAAAGLAAGAFAVNSHRDLGAGVLQPRPGPPRGSEALSRPAGLALRLHRATIVAWAVGLFLGGVAYGSIGSDVEDLIGDNEVMNDVIAQGGGNLIDAFLATTSLALALITAGFAVQGALRLRSEELAGRAEPLLATAVSRRAWAGSHLLVVGAGVVLVVALAGSGTGVSYALVAGDAGDVPRLAAATLVYVPALLVLVGATFALVALAPRAAQLAWTWLALCVVVGYLGEVLDLPEWVRQLSPFEHVPKVPAEPFTVLPLLLLVAVAAGLWALGDAGLRRRDLQT